MRIRVGVLLAVTSLAAGCQTVTNQFSLSATDGSYQTVKVNPETHSAYLISRRLHSIVAVKLSPEKSWSDYGTAVDIKVKNVGKKPVAFGAFGIEVSSGEQKSEILDYAGIQRAIIGRQNAQQATAAFAAFAGGLGAGLYANSPQANPAVASMITQQVAATVQASSVSLANAKAEADVLSEESSTSFLTNVTIPRGGTVGGIVIVPQIAGRAANMTISVGDEQHVFAIASQ